MHGVVDGGHTTGVTDLEHVAALLLDGVGVGVLESSRSFLHSCRCLALSARTPFLIGDAKHLPRLETGDSSMFPPGKCLEQTRLLDVTLSSVFPKTLSHKALLSGFIWALVSRGRSGVQLFVMFPLKRNTGERLRGASFKTQVLYSPIHFTRKTGPQP